MSEAAAREGALSSLVVADSAGHPRRLGDLWAARAAVLVFVRHFG
jgi:hypothetical protein